MSINPHGRWVLIEATDGSRGGAPSITAGTNDWRYAQQNPSRPFAKNCSLEELGQAMDSGPDNKAFRRMNAIHLLLIGVSYPLVLRNSRISDRTLRLWIEAFNTAGIDALAYKPRS
jgi:hypothetical protein